MGRHLLTSYHLWYARGAVAYFIFKAFQSLYPEMGIGATLFVYKDGGKIRKDKAEMGSRIWQNTIKGRGNDASVNV